MAKAGQRKCMSCGEFFIPDHRKGERQRYCCAADCRRASKAASQATWLAQPSNRDYFSGPVLLLCHKSSFWLALPQQGHCLRRAISV